MPTPWPPQRKKPVSLPLRVPIGSGPSLRSSPPPSLCPMKATPLHLLADLHDAMLLQEAAPRMPGWQVERGQEIFRPLPLLSPEAQATLATTRVEAQGQVDQAEQTAPPTPAEVVARYRRGTLPRSPTADKRWVDDNRAARRANDRTRSGTTKA